VLPSFPFALEGDVELDGAVDDRKTTLVRGETNEKTSVSDVSDVHSPAADALEDPDTRSGPDIGLHRRAVCEKEERVRRGKEVAKMREERTVPASREDEHRTDNVRKEEHLVAPATDPSEQRKSVRMSSSRCMKRRSTYLRPKIQFVPRNVRATTPI
jgi:hypothetical protein